MGLQWGSTFPIYTHIMTPIIQTERKYTLTYSRRHRYNHGIRLSKLRVNETSGAIIYVYIYIYIYINILLMCLVLGVIGEKELVYRLVLRRSNENGEN
jgi:hypothetical protein